MLDLRPKYLQLVQDLMKQHLPSNIEVWAYGSRVNDDAYDGSNLDLVLRTADLRPLASGTAANFREALSESNLPIFVDVHDWTQLPASFHDRILARYEVLRPTQTTPVAA